MIVMSNAIFIAFLASISLLSISNAMNIELGVTGNSGTASFDYATVSEPETVAYQEIAANTNPDIATIGAVKDVASATITTSTTSFSGGTASTTSSVANGDMTNTMSGSSGSSGASVTQSIQITGTSGAVEASAWDSRGNVARNSVNIDSNMWGLLAAGQFTTGQGNAAQAGTTSFHAVSDAISFETYANRAGGIVRIGTSTPIRGHPATVIGSMTASENHNGAKAALA